MVELNGIKRGSRFQDLTGRTFGQITVLGLARVDVSKKAIWLCRCICGTEKEVVGTHLRTGNTKSCGCYRAIKNRELRLTHGKSETPEFYCWLRILKRCGCKTSHNYKYYGGRGIQVCERWRASFENFLVDMGPKPSPKHSIERINNDGNYQPENCRWATALEQQRNKRDSHMIEFNGQRRCLSEWAEIIGIHPGTLCRRFQNGWSVNEAFSIKTGGRRIRASKK